MQSKPGLDRVGLLTLGKKSFILIFKFQSLNVLRVKCKVNSLVCVFFKSSICSECSLLTKMNDKDVTDYFKGYKLTTWRISLKSCFLNLNTSGQHPSSLEVVPRRKESVKL